MNNTEMIKDYNQNTISDQMNIDSKKAINFLKSQGITIAFVIMMLVLGSLSDTFLTKQNIITVLLQISVTGVIACGGHSCSYWW